MINYLTRDMAKALRLALPILERNKALQEASYGNNFSEFKVEQARESVKKAKEALYAYELEKAREQVAEYGGPSLDELCEKLRGVPETSGSVPVETLLQQYTREEVSRQMAPVYTAFANACTILSKKKE